MGPSTYLNKVFWWKICAFIGLAMLHCIECNNRGNRPSDDASEIEGIFGGDGSSRSGQDGKRIGRTADPNAYMNTALNIPPGYNFYDIPFEPVGNFTPPINVTFKARIEAIRSVDEINEELTVDIELTLGWTDWKLFAYRHNMTTQQVADYIKSGDEWPVKLVTINNPAYLKSIWKPNLYIYDLISVSQPKLMSDLITLKYDPNGGFMFYLTRVILKLSCQMQFQYYPLDTQSCTFRIRGFSYNEKLLNLIWYKTPYLANREDSNFDVQLTRYDLRKNKLRGEIFNELSFVLLFRRKVSYHIIQTYIPSSFFIIITWLCFLVPASMVEARIGISMTTLLTLTAMFASVRESSPVSAYVKALDIWMVSCIFSVFLTLFEFTLLVWLRHLTQSKKSENEKNALTARLDRLENIKGELDAESKAVDELRPEFQPKASSSSSFDKYEMISDLVEKYAFFVFCVLFVVYNLLYWSWLYTSSDYLNWPELNSTLNSLEKVE